MRNNDKQHACYNSDFNESSIRLDFLINRILYTAINKESLLKEMKFSPTEYLMMFKHTSPTLLYSQQNTDWSIYQ